MNANDLREEIKWLKSWCTLKKCQTEKNIFTYLNQTLMLEDICNISDIPDNFKKESKDFRSILFDLETTETKKHHY